MTIAWGNVKTLLPAIAVIGLLIVVSILAAPREHEATFESDGWTVETYPVPTSVGELAAMIEEFEQ